MLVENVTQRARKMAICASSQLFFPSYRTLLDLPVTACPAQEPRSLQVPQRMEGHIRWWRGAVALYNALNVFLQGPFQCRAFLDLH